MILTEQEAKTKRCQESYAAGAGAHADGKPILRPVPENMKDLYDGADHTITNYAPVNCIGSGCMAWRWHEIGRDPQTGRVLVVGNTGYCGKAGKP